MPIVVKTTSVALLPRFNNQHINKIPATQMKFLTYGDLKIASKAILTGIIIPDDLKKAQIEDVYCTHHLETTRKKISENFLCEKVAYSQNKQTRKNCSSLISSSSPSTLPYLDRMLQSQESKGISPTSTIVNPANSLTNSDYPIKLPVQHYWPSRLYS
jgi:hypothetical protein